MANDDPFYIADVSHCAKQYLKWHHYFPNIKPFYAVKTNDSSFILQVMAKMGSGFDCASSTELDAVLSMCPNIDCSKRIIYAHPCKQISHIKHFKERGVELTVADNESEMLKIKMFWPNAKILIRLKTNDSKSLIPLSTKFGANKLMSIRLLKLAKELNLEVIGCSFHVGTGCYDADTFRHSLQFSKHFFDVAKQAGYGMIMKILDIGGGFPGIEEDGKPSFSEMAKVINESIMELFSNDQGKDFIFRANCYFSV